MNELNALKKRFRKVQQDLRKAVQKTEKYKMSPLKAAKQRKEWDLQQMQKDYTVKAKLENEHRQLWMKIYKLIRRVG